MSVTLPQQVLTALDEISHNPADLTPEQAARATNPPKGLTRKTLATWVLDGKPLKTQVTESVRNRTTEVKERRRAERAAAKADAATPAVDGDEPPKTRRVKTPKATTGEVSVPFTHGGSPDTPVTGDGQGYLVFIRNPETGDKYEFLGWRPGADRTALAAVVRPELRAAYGKSPAGEEYADLLEIVSVRPNAIRTLPPVAAPAAD